MKTNGVPLSDRIVPRFENEADEADWWFEHREMVEQDMVAALAQGHRGVHYRLAPAPTNIITLSAADEQAARQAAAQCGETYEMFVRRVVHEALQLDQTA